MDNDRLVSDSLQLLENIGKLPEPAAKPFFIAVSGLPGTGKTYLCQRLSEKLPVVLLESDSLRKALFPHPTYSFTESNYLFKTIHYLIKLLLSRGIPVVLDATNLSERNREYLYNIADHLGVKLVLVRVSAPPELVRARLEARRKDTGTKSDADWEVYLKMKPSEEMIQREHFTVDTSENIAPAIEKIVREVSR